MNKGFKSLLTTSLIAGAITLSQSLFIVDQTQHAVVTRFGNPKRVILNSLPFSSREKINQFEKETENNTIPVSQGAGIYFKMPFIETARKFDKRVMIWNGFTEEIPTKDKKYLLVDSTVRWYIEDPLTFLQKVGTEQQAHARLDDIIDSQTRNAISSRDLIELVRSSNRPMQVMEKELEESVQVGEITEGRNKIMKEVYEESRNICEQYGIGITLGGYLITSLTYVDSVKEKVEERMISERTRIAEKYRSEGKGEAQKISGEIELELKTIQSEAYRKAQDIRGKADQQAVSIYGNAYMKNPQFYEFSKALEVYKKTLSGSKIILGTDNDFLRYLQRASSKINNASKN